jgi:hypothetical protein
MTARDLILILQKLAPDTKIYGDGTPKDEIFPVTRVEPIRFTRYDLQREDDVEHEGVCLS